MCKRGCTKTNIITKTEIQNLRNEVPSWSWIASPFFFSTFSSWSTFKTLLSVFLTGFLHLFFAIIKYRIGLPWTPGIILEKNASRRPNRFEKQNSPHYSSSISPNLWKRYFWNQQKIFNNFQWIVIINKLHWKSFIFLGLL